ncbi:hypothetical protein [uncultured Tateyamaria sp.]|uniref:hypothetical protein n=1 Tax=uncultured Tateyamaria sp. TaxID=455651 RepID=UPI00260F4CB0|nr:hypothetical protein [uncultured Tateyamaria sp.]
MSLSHLFQDFGTLKPASVGKKSLNAEEIEDLKLQAFEGGFQAGWDEAVKAQSETMTHVSSGLAASLQNASFEYHELRRTLHESVQSILSEVVETILPLAAHASLGRHICDLIGSTSLDALDRTIEIAVAPGRDEAVRQVLSAELPEPFEVVVDQMMSPNQAILRVGAKEAELNLDKTVAEIATAVTNFFETRKSEVKDG